MNFARWSNWLRRRPLKAELRVRSSCGRFEATLGERKALISTVLTVFVKAFCLAKKAFSKQIRFTRDKWGL